MRIKLIALFVFISFAQLALMSSSFATEVYKTVDKNGRVIYTDKPSTDSESQSEKVNIGEPITVPGVIPASRPQRRNSSEQQNAPSQYTVSITQPLPETHINPGVFTVAIQTSTDPAIHESHQLVILDNGNAIPSPVIQYITPGSHRFVAQVLNEKGKVLGESAPVMVYVHRPNLNNRRQQDR